MTSVWARPWGRAAVATLALWCGLELGCRRSSTITDDWHGWRQADTQTIARNFAFEEFNLRAPRIDWRGDGAGYVEAELQLYPAFIALVMRVTGESEWPGQLLSLVCVALAAAVLFAALARRWGDAAAYLGLIGLLATKGTAAMATSIQPDALSLLDEARMLRTRSPRDRATGEAPSYVRDMAVLWWKTGVARAALSQRASWSDAFESAIAMMTKLVTQANAPPGWSRDLSIFRSAYADALARAGRASDARRQWTEALTLTERQLRINADDPRLLQDRATLRLRLGLRPAR